MRGVSLSRAVACALCICVAVMLGADGVAFAQKHGGTLRVSLRDNPASASVHEEYSTAATAFMPVFNNLVTFDPTAPQNSVDAIAPDLAESWSWNPDKTALTFSLRRGVKWHDGWAFTAGDVECTFNLLTGRSRDRLRNNPRANWYENIDEVQGATDHEVTIYLKRPQPALLTLLASGLAPIYPCHVPAAQMRVHPVGTGPFKLDSFSQFDSIRLIRNPDYFKPDRPYLDGIEFRIAASPSTAMLSFVAGRFHITAPGQVSIQELRDVRRQAPRVMCQTTPMNQSTDILINHAAAPFDRAEIRRALLLALDRRAVIAGLREGNAQLGGLLPPPGEGLWGMPAERLASMPGYGPDVEQNREESRTLMRKAGFGPGKHLRLKIATRPQAVHRGVAVALAVQLSEIYIDADLDVIQSSQWDDRLARKSWTVAIDITTNGVDDPDQAFFEKYACHSERNHGRYCNRALEGLFAQQSTESDHAKRRELVWQIEAKLISDAARAVIMWNSNATCWHPHVKGYMPQVNGMFNGLLFEDVWLDD